MEALERHIEKILGREGERIKVLVGGALCFIPLFLIPVAGYWVRYLRNLQRNPASPLPEWCDWIELLRDGLRGILLLLPLLALWALMGLLVTSPLGFGLLLPGARWVGLIVGGAVLGILPGLTASALFQLSLRRRLVDLLDYREWVLRPFVLWEALLVPTCALLGLNLIGIGLYGLAFFLGFTVYLSYCLPLFQAHRRARQNAA